MLLISDLLSWTGHCQTQLIGRQNFYRKFLSGSRAQPHHNSTSNSRKENLRKVSMLSCCIIKPSESPDNIKLLLEKFSTRVLIVTNFRLHQISQYSKIFQAWNSFNVWLELTHQLINYLLPISHSVLLTPLPPVISGEKRNLPTWGRGEAP